MIYMTTFDSTTKKPLGPSVPLHMECMKQASKSLGMMPDSQTKNTIIYKQPNNISLCVSWIRFSI